MSAFTEPPALGAARYGRAVTPNNDADLPDGICSALYFGGAGEVSVVHPEGAGTTSYSVVAGGYLMVHVQRVRATGTNATGIVALYGG